MEFKNYIKDYIVFDKNSFIIEKSNTSELTDKVGEICDITSKAKSILEDDKDSLDIVEIMFDNSKIIIKPDDTNSLSMAALIKKQKQTNKL